MAMRRLLRRLEEAVVERPRIIDPKGFKVSLLQGRPALVTTDDFMGAAAFDPASMTVSYNVRWLTPDDPITAADMAKIEGEVPSLRKDRFELPLGMGVLQGTVERPEIVKVAVDPTQLNPREITKLQQWFKREGYQDVTSLGGAERDWRRVLAIKDIEQALEDKMGEALINRRLKMGMSEKAAWTDLGGVYATTNRGESIKFVVKHG